MEKQSKYFETLEQAEKFVKEHKIKFYHFEKPLTFFKPNHLALLNLDKGIILKIEETFICEICHEETPSSCEGAEPNTCAMCMPFTDKGF